MAHKIAIPALTPQGIAGITVGAALRGRPRPAGVIFSALGAIFILCAPRNFTRSDFRHGQASPPERGWCRRYGVAASLLARIPHNDGTTAPSGSERLDMPIFLKIFSSCLSCPSWTTGHIKITNGQLSEEEKGNGK